MSKSLRCYVMYIMHSLNTLYLPKFCFFSRCSALSSKLVNDKQLEKS